MLSDLNRCIRQDANLSAGREAAEFQAAAQKLLTRQFVHVEDFGCRTHYETIRANLSFYEDLFGALGYRLVRDDNAGMVGITTDAPLLRGHLAMDESIFLLALRLAYERAVEGFDIGNGGAAEVECGAVLDQIEAATHRMGPSLSRVREILNTFQSKGIIRFEEKGSDGKDIGITVRPCIRLVTGPDFLALAESYGQPKDRAEAAQESQP